MRDQSIDIYKGLLIFLVVFGHFLERLLGWQDALAKNFLQNKKRQSIITASHLKIYLLSYALFFAKKTN